MVKYVRRCALVLGLLLFGQLSSKAQTFALKTDVLNWATASFNIEPEVRVGDNSTLALGLSWNPWTFKESTANRKWRHLRVQPEYRYWFCRPFGGHFLGLHASYTRFNAGLRTNILVSVGVAAFTIPVVTINSLNLLKSGCSMELDYKAIGKRIKIARSRAEITQEKLSEIAGVSPTHLSNIETGTTRVSLCTLINIANALKVTSDDLLCDNIIKANVQFERDISLLLEDCDEYEIRIIRDIAAAAKESLRRDAHLRNLSK